MERSENISQLVRSNTENFAHWYEQIIRTSPHLTRLSALRGTVPLDMNSANFGFIETERGWGFEFVDYDDVAREMPLLASLTNSVVNLLGRLEKKAKYHHVAILAETLFDSMIQGLNGKKVKPPGFIQEILDQSPGQVQKTAEQYVKGKTKFGGQYFAIDGVKLKNLRFNSRKKKEKFREEVAQILGVKPDAVLDFALRPKNRGGSANKKRIWVLYIGPSGTRIAEFKQPSTPHLGDRLQFDLDRVRSFNRDFNGISHYEHLMGRPPFIAELGGEEFLVKQKEPTVLEVDHLSRSEQIQLSQYELYLWGRSIASQGVSVRSIETPRDYFIGAITELSHIYFGLVRQNWKSAQSKDDEK